MATVDFLCAQHSQSIFCRAGHIRKSFAGHVRAISAHSARSFPLEPGGSANNSSKIIFCVAFRSRTLWPNSWLHICALQWQWQWQRQGMQLNRLRPPLLFEPPLVGVPVPHPHRKAAIKILYSSCGSSWKVF